MTVCIYFIYPFCHITKFGRVTIVVQHLEYRTGFTQEPGRSVDDRCYTSHSVRSMTLKAGTVLLTVAWCRDVFLGTKMSVTHFGTSANMSGQFGTGAKVSYGHFGISAEMSLVQTVMGLKCLCNVVNKHCTCGDLVNLLGLMRRPTLRLTDMVTVCGQYGCGRYRLPTPDPNACSPPSRNVM